MKRAIYYKVRKNGETYYNTICECGLRHIEKKDTVKICEGCKENLANRYLYYEEGQEKNAKLEFCRYENINESQTGFEIHSLIDRYIFDGKVLKLENVSNPYKLIVNFKNSDYKLVDRKGKESEITEGRSRQFFFGTWDFQEVLKLNTNKMFVRAIEPLGKLKTSYDTSATRAFDKAFKDENFVRCIQILVSANIPVNLIHKLSILKDDSCGYYYGYGYGISINYKILNFKETKPHKILNTEKSNLEILKYWSDKADYNEWVQEINQYNKNDIKYIIEVLENEIGKNKAIEFLSDIKDFNKLVKEYKYKPRDLTKYLVRDVKLEQGIENPRTAMGLLKDLNRMCRDRKSVV